MSQEDRIASILGDWQAQRERGEAPAPDKVILAHPDLAEGLRARFSALGALEVAVAGGAGGGKTGSVHLRKVALERYRDFKKVGQGGMGIVYLALDTELNRSVAFKVVRPDIGSDEGPGPAPEMPLALSPPTLDTPASQAFATLKARFLQEAWVTGGMEHPGIVPVYEVGETPEGVPYYTMRFVKGTRTLAQAIAEVDGKPVEERLALLEPFLKVCDAVRYAHARGVIHRDLKPENVALGEFGEVVVLDWGLAKVRGQVDSPVDPWLQRIQEYRQATDLRTVAGLLGTPGYMAPEAARGDPNLLDARTDVYSLGAILFRILTGRLPHALGNFGEFLTALVAAPAPAAISVDASVPPGLSRACAQALERLPTERTASVEHLVADVRGWQRQNTSEAEIAGLLQQAQAELTAAGEARPRLRARPLDRATAAVEQVLTRHPGHGDARRLRADIQGVRAQAAQEQGADARRRLVRRVLGGAVLLGGLAVLGLLWQSSQHSTQDDALRIELESTRRNLVRYRGPALASTALASAAAGRATEARAGAAQAWDDVLRSERMGSEERERAWNAVQEAWPLWAPAAVRFTATALPLEVLKDPKAEENPVAGACWAGEDLVVLLRSGGLWRLPLPGSGAGARHLDGPREAYFGDTSRLSVAPDGRWAAAMTRDGRTLCVWDLMQGRFLQAFETLAWWALPFTDAQGRRKLLVSGGLTLRVLDAENGTEVRRFAWPDESGAPLDAVVLGQRAIVAVDKGVIEVDLETGGRLRTWDGHARHLVLGGDGTWVAGWRQVPGSQGECRMWDARTGALLRSFALPAGQRHACAFSPAGDLVAVSTRKANQAGGGGDAPGIVLLDVGSGNRLAVLADSLPYESVLAFRPDGAFLAAGSLSLVRYAPEGLTVAPLVWDTRVEPDVRSVAVGSNGPVMLEDGLPAVAVGPAGVAWLERRGDRVSLRTHPVRRDEPAMAFEVASDAACLALDPSGERVFVGTHAAAAEGSTGQILAYDLASGTELTALPAEPGGVRCLSVSRAADALWLMREGQELPRCRLLPSLADRPHASATFPAHQTSNPHVRFRARRLEALPDGEGVVIEWLGRAAEPSASAAAEPMTWVQSFSRSRGWNLSPHPQSFVRGWDLTRAGNLRWYDGSLRTMDPLTGGEQAPLVVIPDAVADRPTKGTGLAVSDDDRLQVIPAIDSGPTEVPELLRLRGSAASQKPVRLRLGHREPLERLFFVPALPVVVSVSRHEIRLHDLGWLLLDSAERVRRTSEAGQTR